MKQFCKVFESKNFNQTLVFATPLLDGSGRVTLTYMNNSNWNKLKIGNFMTVTQEECGLKGTEKRIIEMTEEQALKDMCIID